MQQQATGPKVGSVNQLGRLFIILGAVLLLVGIVLIVGDRLGLGRLPGDITWRRKGVTVYVPIATSIVLTIVLTIVLNLWLRKR